MRAHLLLVALAVCAALAPFAGAHAQGCSNVPPQPATVADAQTYIYRTASGRPLRVHVFRPEGEGVHPAILFFFGGGWRQGSVTQFLGQAEAAKAKGYVAILADYRVVCRDGVSPVESTSDARAAYAWLLDHAVHLGVDSRRIVLSGGSAGGQLAAVTAMLAPSGEAPAALVLFNPALDLTTLAPLLKLAPGVAASISPSALPINDLPPTIIFHGVADVVVPIQIARAFCNRAEAAGRSCELHEYPGQNHGFFNSHAADPASHISPYDDTLLRTFDFLRGLPAMARVPER